MLRPRIIPCLLIQDGGLVKTVKFKDPKYVGDPINAVKIFNEKEADELIVIDIDATAHGVEPNYIQIAKLAAECRMPLCYGGGIRTAEQAKKIIQLGVEKVAISSAALENPQLVTQIAEEIGSQSVVVVLDHKSRLLSKHQEVWTHNGTRNTKRNVVEVAQELEKLGAGEIVLNSIENDGKMKGYDLDLASKLRAAVHIPITILGGGGSLEDMASVVKTCGVVGVAAGSFFVFKGAYRAVLISYPSAQQKDDIIYSALRAR
ncbi:imidazole glycerol phosphate synthase subunit HisF [Pseudomonas plecoglossicida]|jgi:cyclase|uniref:AglZ/HisF2 family acetamidino modification protein n=1 Tax=Pseudomonas TaxID=286 RepID=UPI0003D91E9F|nr:MULTISPECIES: AglZ/HisF2 family acetamidino modification protein [Pseudomonas]AHD13432.1 imidazole glycerol phosphate synthase [Pseudomonas sp. FGI182]MBO2924337.1 imidazole glycerol phosphate synthase subunit HisF [Pseudomonas asiatica]MDD2026173.1 AglZ/HisF2 family acetamidino modification protein [Pseudomonas putida]PJI73697.1 imidazole glycerol phosphate synthase subunit HisF [Pseudomonas sp. MR 02]PLU96298.1 imidazole glycerol phosphate synthase subunit HisF [Pseudomonas plecoglossicid